MGGAAWVNFVKGDRIVLYSGCGGGYADLYVIKLIELYTNKGEFHRM